MIYKEYNHNSTEFLLVFYPSLNTFRYTRKDVGRVTEEYCNTNYDKAEAAFNGAVSTYKQRFVKEDISRV